MKVFGVLLGEDSEDVIGELTGLPDSIHVMTLSRETGCSLADHLRDLNGYGSALSVQANAVWRIRGKLARRVKRQAGASVEGLKHLLDDTELFAGLIVGLEERRVGLHDAKRAFTGTEAGTRTDDCQ